MPTPHNLPRLILSFDHSPLHIIGLRLLVVVALVSVKSAWDAYSNQRHLAMPILLAPIAWLLFMGAIFALVDFLEDGVIGNARRG